MRVSVITISDRASRGEYADASGPEIEGLLREAYPTAEIRRQVVPDEREAILEALRSHTASDWVLTTGGTGIGPRDVTPEATEAFCERALPGIAEALRRESYRETPFALLSRGAAGMRGRCIVVNFPGSVKAVRLCTRILIPVMEHGIAMLAGEGHG
ncbi:MAG: MogA/MoaB family molybdenum cofactor biosynthesis protein [Spirochaetales bacterium]|nr:MogA/MoaB family molybdenum cofactor biosynthesis protein [Spirochaetales bacterium]